MSKKLLVASRVDSERWPAVGVRELTFVPRHRSEFPPFEPGDHVQVQHLTGTRRDYSLCGSPHDLSHYTVAIQRQEGGRGGSILLHEGVKVGDDIFVSYPQEGIRLDPAASRHIFIAGGIGITAIIGLLRGLENRPILKELHYSFRSQETAPYLDVLSQLCSSLTVYDSSRHDRANVTEVAQSARLHGTLYYCGPTRMMAEIDAVVDGWPSGRARSESYVPAVRPNEKLGQSFEAHLGIGGQTIHVPDNKSLLQALIDGGIPMDYSCEGGICGSCVVDLIEGEVIHKDMCLSPEERCRSMTTCVSRGKGTIAIQI